MYEHDEGVAQERKMYSLVDHCNGAVDERNL